MEFTWNEEIEEFRQQVRTFVKEHTSPELQKEVEAGGPEGEGGRGPLLQKVYDELDSRGWTRIAWPQEYGGGGKSPWYQYTLVEEFSYGGIPYGGMSTGSVAPALMNFGSEEQKERFLPGIMDGRITFALGYSEPNAGTDLASLQTRATKDGDEWVVNGQKIWTTGAHSSTHIWLAARTDPEAPKHRGISLFIVPLDRDGITVRPIYTMAGLRTNEVFFEDVHVQKDEIVGEENRGWYTVANALDHERVTLAPLGGLVKDYDRIIRYMQQKRPDLPKQRQVQLRMADLKIDMHIQRALKLTNAAIIANGGTPTMEASMTKVWSSELRGSMSSLMMDVFGRSGGLRKESGELAPLGGSFEQSYRGSPVSRFGGGTNEVQRGIIAQRGLGLPR